MSAHWIVLALLTAVAFGAYNFFIKISSEDIHALLGAVILQFCALFLGLAALLFLHFRGVSFNITRSGIGFATVAGVCVGLAEILTFYVFATGVSAARGVPVIVGGSLAFGALFGIVFLEESLSRSGWLGIVAILVGVFLLASDNP